MLFPTLSFAAFFAVVLPVSWILMPHRVRWRLFMVAVSWIFYGAADWRFVPLLAGSTIVNHFFARRIYHAAGRARRIWTIGAVTTNLAVLGWFKYIGFLSLSSRSLLHFVGIHAHVPLPEVLLPIGISFFTFQALSYVIDTSRGKIQPVSLLEFAVYLSFFPHLVAGPIVRATEFLPQIKERIRPRHVDVGKAFWLISLGLFKKVVIASYLATYAADPVFGFPRQHAGVEALFGVYAYAIQIYADFSGYTDIAIGLALLLGIQFPQNFNSPYAAASLQDFWRRWHMTLSRWLRDYLYIPLGGSRRGRVRTYVNVMITMLLGGLWHGAAWTFVAWGALHGAGLVVERVRHERRSAPIGADPDEGSAQPASLVGAAAPISEDSLVTASAAASPGGAGLASGTSARGRLLRAPSPPSSMSVPPAPVSPPTPSPAPEPSMAPPPTPGDEAPFVRRPKVATLARDEVMTARVVPAISTTATSGPGSGPAPANGAALDPAPGNGAPTGPEPTNGGPESHGATGGAGSAPAPGHGPDGAPSSAQDPAAPAPAGSPAQDPGAAAAASVLAPPPLVPPAEVTGRPAPGAGFRRPESTGTPVSASLGAPPAATGPAAGRPRPRLPLLSSARGAGSPPAASTPAAVQAGADRAAAVPPGVEAGAVHAGADRAAAARGAAVPPGVEAGAGTVAAARGAAVPPGVEAGAGTVAAARGAAAPPGVEAGVDTAGVTPPVVSLPPAAGAGAVPPAGRLRLRLSLPGRSAVNPPAGADAAPPARRARLRLRLPVSLPGRRAANPPAGDDAAPAAGRARARLPLMSSTRRAGSALAGYDAAPATGRGRRLPLLSPTRRAGSAPGGDDAAPSAVRPRLRMPVSLPGRGAANPPAGQPRFRLPLPVSWPARRAGAAPRPARPRRPPLSPTAQLWVGRLITFHVVCLAWIFFRATSFHNAIEVLRRIATLGGHHQPFNWKVAAVVVGALAIQVGSRGVGARLQIIFARSPLWCQVFAVAAVLTTIDLLGPAGIAPFIYFRF
jgi:alginate O-acetyltransferase complex protein AlgI